MAPSNAPATAPPDTPYQDFVIGPVATKPFWQEIDDTTGTPQQRQASLAGLLQAPAAGRRRDGVRPGQPEQLRRGDGRRSGSLKVAYKDENGNTVKDVDGTTNCGPYVLHRTEAHRSAAASAHPAATIAPPPE